MSTEFWITYRFTSRAHVPPTTQLVELENPDYRLTDLEDVLDHVFRQGFVEARYRPVAWWEKRGGVPVKASTTIEFLLNEGIGKCPDNSLHLVIEDAPTDLWFSYIYIHNPPAEVVAQRIKFASLQKRFEKIAHVTNFVFAQGYLPAKYRPHVFWETPCGKRISECASVDEVLVAGEGVSEERPLRFVIGTTTMDHATSARFLTGAITIIMNPSSIVTIMNPSSIITIMDVASIVLTMSLLSITTMNLSNIAIIMSPSSITTGAMSSVNNPAAALLALLLRL